MNKRHFVSGIFLSVLLSGDVEAAEGEFISLSRPPRAMVLDAAGQIVVGDERSVIRFTSGGAVDASFGFVEGWSLGVENDGTILFLDIAAIQRLNFEAAQQSTAARPLDSFVLQPDGKMVGPVINPPPRNPRNTFSRFNADGSADPEFAATLFNGSYLMPMALEEDGQIVLAGAQDGTIYRFNSDGTRDNSFNAPLIEPARANAVVVQPDGKILIGGEFQSAGEALRLGLLRLNANGSLDVAFDPGSELTTKVHALALQADGKIIVAGIFSSIGGGAANNIARLNSDGTLDTTFQDPALEAPQLPLDRIVLALEEDGSVLVNSLMNLVRIPSVEPATQSLTREGSTLTWMRGGSSPEVYHARFHASLDGITWVDLGRAERIAGGWRLSNADIPEGSRLRARGYVSGTSYYIDYVPGAPALYYPPVAARTVNFDTNVTFRISAKGAEPLAYQWFKNGEAIAGATSRILELTGVNGGDTGDYHVVVSNAEGSSTSGVSHLTVIDPILVQQPHSIWINAGGETNLSVTAVGSGLSYQWRKNEEDIPGANAPTLEFPSAAPEDTGKYQVIITGTYGTLESRIVTVRVNAIVPSPYFQPKWEPTTQWFPIQAAVAYNNDLFVGGLFKMVDAPQQKDLVKIDANGTIDPLFAPVFSGGVINGVISMSLTANRQLLVGGNFKNVNGADRAYLARLNLDGSLDESFRPTIDGINNGIYTQVASIEVLPDGRILIGGGFASVNGESRPGLALLFPDGALDESFNPHQTNAPGITWGSIVQASGKIIAYGWDYHRYLPDGTLDLDFMEAVTANSFQPIPLASGQLLINSQQGVGPGVLTLVDADGNPEPNFKLPTHVSAEAEQANGEILVGQVGEPIATEGTNGATVFHNTSFLLRMSLDGIEDPAFSPIFDNYALYKAMRADGSMLFAGAFSNIAGISIPKLALLKNSEDATQSLRLEGTTATWLRSATSPEVLRTKFEFSGDGVTWTNLGAGSRTVGGWKVEGVQISATGLLRASGFFRGSLFETTVEILRGMKLGIPQYHAETGEVIVDANTSTPVRAILQKSVDLKEWINLQTNTMTLETLQLTLTDQTAPYAFYRLLQTTAE